LKLEEVLDIIINDTSDEAKSLKPEPEKKKDEETVTYTEYFCSSCTFKNDENPGPKCSICMSDAPESAKVVKVSEKQKAETQKKQKDEEEARKQSEREEK
jgi:nitrous oxide reductase accessory protein NosL